jgi:hypothetical protein
MSHWKLTDEFVRLGSKWVTLIGERWLSDKGRELEYWRVEKVDSVIVLPIQAGRIFCGKPSFRVGIHRSTLDFPGGRLPEGMLPENVVPVILENELAIPSAAIRNALALNHAKWNVNSSFSNQGLWGFVVEIDEAFTIPESHVGTSVMANDNGISELLSQLDCLQCRTVLLEWWRQKGCGHGFGS